MRKKDYELIAGALKGAGYYHDIDVTEVARFMAVVFKDKNSRFDRNKFLTACGIETERKPYKGTQFEQD